MSIKRLKAKRDANEAEIIKALRQCGCFVQQVSEKGMPDLCVGYMRTTYLIEVKEKRGKLTPDQVIWHEKWRGQPIYIVHDVHEALEVIGVK